MDKTALTELRDRARGLSGPDRDIDRELSTLFWTTLSPECGARMVEIWSENDHDRDLMIERYTESVDAALGLVGKLLPDWWIKSLNGTPDNTGFHALLIKHAPTMGGPLTGNGLGPTLPLAIIDAFLAALIAEPALPIPKTETEGG